MFLAGLEHALPNTRQRRRGDPVKALWARISKHYFPVASGAWIVAV